MSDVIRLVGLRAFGFHGVLERERSDGQTFIVDLELVLSLAAAAASDDVSDTVHYGEVADVAMAVIEGDPCDLIETVAGRIADRVLAAFPLVDTVRVVLHKPEAPIAHTFEDVAVAIERNR